MVGEKLITLAIIIMMLIIVLLTAAVFCLLDKIKELKEERDAYKIIAESIEDIV